MRLSIDPMPMMRLQAIARVNEHFNRRFHERAHIDHAHGRKRQIAVALMAGETIDPEHPFAKEAEMRGVNVSDFAQVIANKPCNISARELHRQQAIAAIEAAVTPAELDEITSKIG
jgi:Uri superfamily endonuclease